MSQKLRKALKIYSKTYYDVHKIINKRETFAKLKILNGKKDTVCCHFLLRFTVFFFGGYHTTRR